MKWRRTQSEHVDDLRGMSGGRLGMGAAAGGGRLGLVVLLLNVLGGGGGGSIGDVLGQLGGVPAAQPGSTPGEWFDRGSGSRSDRSDDCDTFA